MEGLVSHVPCFLCLNFPPFRPVDQVILSIPQYQPQLGNTKEIWELNFHIYLSDIEHFLI